MPKSAAPSYLILCADAHRDDLEAVDDYELVHEVITAPWSGKKIHDWSPNALRITLDEGSRADVLGCPISWLIVSRRVRNTILKFAPDAVQVLPLHVSRNGRTIKADYFLINQLRKIDAVAGKGPKRSKLAISEIRLDAAKIPPDAHIFYLATHRLMTIILRELFDAITATGATGIAGVKLRFAAGEK